MSAYIHLFVHVWFFVGYPYMYKDLNAGQHAKKYLRAALDVKISHI